MQSVQIPSYTAKIARGDSLASKLTDLDIESDLKVSILAGGVKLEGSAKFARRGKEEKSEVSASLILNLFTVKERINVPMLKELENIDILESAVWTHVVSGIWWGAQAVITFSAVASSREDSKELVETLKSSLARISPSFSVDGKVETNYKGEDVALLNKFSVAVDTDLLPEIGSPRSVEEAIKFIQMVLYKVLYLDVYTDVFFSCQTWQKQTRGKAGQLSMRCLV